MTKHNHLNILSRIDRNLSDQVKAGEIDHAEFVRVRGLVREEMMRVLALDDDVDTYTGLKVATSAAQTATNDNGDDSDDDDMATLIFGEDGRVSSMIGSRVATSSFVPAASRAGHRFGMNGMRLDCMLSA